MSTITTTVTVTDDTFDAEVLQSNIPVLVDFWAPWCGPCKAIGPVLEELAGEYAGKVKIAKVNVDENTAQASQYGVRSIPYLILIQNGEMVESLVGAHPKSKFTALLDQYVK